MSRRTVMIIGLVVAAAGFAAGRMSAPSSADSRWGASSDTEPDTAASADVDSGWSPMRQDLGRGAEELRDIFGIRDPYERANRLAQFLPTLDASVIPALKVLIFDPATQLRGVETELVAHFWATYDPGGASRWAFSRVPLGYRVVAVVPAVRAWAAQDPQAAQSQVKLAGLSSSIAVEAAQVALVEGWFESGRPGLLEYIESLGDSIARQRALATYARMMVHSKGPDAAMVWAESMPDEPRRYKLSAHRQLASELANIDLAAARRWCDAQCAGEYGDTLPKIIATRWAMQDGEAALTWLSTQPEGPERDLAVRVAFKSWATLSKPAAFQWLGDHGIAGVEPWLVPAVTIYSRLISQDDPALALEWAALIPNDLERETSMVRIARRLRNKDEAAGEKWLDQSPLSERQRNQARSLDALTR